LKVIVQRYGSNAGIDVAERCREHLENGDLERAPISH
jgi:hypothetical protein